MATCTEHQVSTEIGGDYLYRTPVSIEIGGDYLYRTPSQYRDRL